MQLPFDADQATYDTWQAYWMKRVEDPTDPFMRVDLNDMIVVFATAQVIAYRHPELRDKLKQHVPDVVTRAGEDLGMFMGVTHLANLIGLDGKEARESVFEVLK